MKKGLTQPPIEAPTLPFDFYYKIRGYTDSDYGDAYWSVRIKKPRRFWFDKSVGWGTNRRAARDLGLLTGACVVAYDDMERAYDMGRDRDIYSGKWSGQ